MKGTEGFSLLILGTSNQIKVTTSVLVPWRETGLSKSKKLSSSPAGASSSRSHSLSSDTLPVACIDNVTLSPGPVSL